MNHKYARIELCIIKIDQSAIDVLAESGFVPEFGARELKRKIQNEVETRLARELLSGRIEEGDAVDVKYDRSDRQMIFAKRQPVRARKEASKARRTA